MSDLQNKKIKPAMTDFEESIRNPVFAQFCLEIINKYNCSERVEYSSCSLEKGWNVKFKKSGKSLCTIYPREGYFTVMVVIGKKEKEAFGNILSRVNEQLRNIYLNAREFNSQRWLMLDLEDKDEMYEDIMTLIKIRAGK